MNHRDALSHISRRALLCALDEIPDPGARGFRVNLAGEPVEIFVVRKRDKVYGYFNRCPHTGINLEWLPDRFLDSAGGSIVCATHGALFYIETGRCFEGPCAGDHLTPAKIETQGGRIFLVDDG